MSVQLLSILLAVTPLLACEQVSERVAAYSNVRRAWCYLTKELISDKRCLTQDSRLELVISNGTVVARSDRKRFLDLPHDPKVNAALVRCTSMEFRGDGVPEHDERGFILHNATVTFKQGDGHQIVFDAPNVVYDDKLNSFRFRASDHAPVRIRVGNHDSEAVCIRSAIVDITPAEHDAETEATPGMPRRAPATGESGDPVESKSESAATDSIADTEFLFFTASYCAPCQEMMPIITRIQEVSRIRVVDITDNRDLALSCKVDRIPQLVVVEKGKVLRRLVGFNTESAVRHFLANPKRSGTD